MKKVLVALGLLVVVALVVSLAACGGTDEPTPEVSQPIASPEPTEAPPEPTEAPPEPTEVPPTEAPPEPTEVPPTEAPPEPTELRIGLSVDVESMDPFFVNQAAGWSVVHALFDHLVERDFEGNIVPGLALGYTIVDTATL